MLFCRLMESDARLCVATIAWSGELEAWCLGEGGRWVRSHAVKLPRGRRLPQPHALQRGHLLLHDEDQDEDEWYCGES